MERLRQREWFNPTKGCEGRLLAKLRGEQVVEQKVSLPTAELGDQTADRVPDT